MQWMGNERWCGDGGYLWGYIDEMRGMLNCIEYPRFWVDVIINYKRGNYMN